MKPDNGIARPAKGSGFQPICWFGSIFFSSQFQGRNAAENNSWLTEDRQAFCSDVSPPKNGLNKFDFL